MFKVNNKNKRMTSTTLYHFMKKNGKKTLNIENLDATPFAFL